MNTSNNYNAKSIKVLKGLKAIQVRPSMFIGDVETLEGLHQLAEEVIANAVDEALGGYCSVITIILHRDGSLSVEDGGRGIPCDIVPGENKPAAEIIMTEINAGGKFPPSEHEENAAYGVSGGMHGIGVSAVNALSTWLALTIKRDNQVHYMKFEKGDTVEPLHVIGKTDSTGTLVHFLPDNQVFTETTFDSSKIQTRLTELSFLNPGIKFILEDYRGAELKRNVFIEKEGALAFVNYITNNREQLVSPIQCVSDNLDVNCSFVWTNHSGENCYYFTNTILQNEGGTHAAGFKNGLTRAIQSYIKDKGTKVQQKYSLVGEDVRDGLSAIVSVKVKDPSFASQTKNRLVSGFVRTLVENIIYDKMSMFLEENPKAAQLIITRIIEAAHARESARKARELVKNKSVSDFGKISKKLADCSSKNPQEKVLFIVEGDSAGGTAKDGRNRQTQAVLSLKGKILNTEKAQERRILQSEEIRTLVSVLGCGIGESFNYDKLNYHKIVLLSDADHDGLHLSCLLLSFLLKYMKPLLLKGHVYLAQPPLYSITQNKVKQYFTDDADFAKYIMRRGTDDTTCTVSGDKIPQDVLLKYLHRCSKIQGIIKQYGFIVEAALNAKIFNESILEKAEQRFVLLQYLKDNFVGQWSYDGARYTQEVHGREYHHILDLNEIEPEHMQALFQFTMVWSMMWGQNVQFNEHNVNKPFDLLTAVEKIGRHNLHIQRYKGLGEMNADELADTAMTHFKQLVINDLSLAEKICLDLMGEPVQPRKDFIEKYAKNAEIEY